jgi:acetyl esterase/lipase
MRFLLFVLAVLLTGCSPLAYINLQISRKMQVVKDIPYDSKEIEAGTIDYGKSLDIYTRQDIPSKGIVIFVHGGYWDTGDKSDYPFLADSLTEAGFTTVVVNYRLVPTVTFPRYVEDVALAVKWTVDNVANYGGNADTLFLMGHSAGAQIAALVAFDERYLQRQGLPPTTIDGFIGLAGPYDFLPVAPDDVRSVAALGSLETYADTQPINFVDSSEPPAFVGYTLKDKTVNPNNSIRFAEKIREVGGKVEEHQYTGVDHITLLGSLSRASRFFNKAILEDILAFLQR